MLIKCLGQSTNGKSIECEFHHLGVWNDKQLIEHEKSHKEGKSNYWLGFEVLHGYKRERGSVDS